MGAVYLYESLGLLLAAGLGKLVPDGERTIDEMTGG